MPNDQAHRLSDMEFDEVSLVTRGANQRSNVVLYKSDAPHDFVSKPGGARGCKQCDGDRDNPNHKKVKKSWVAAIRAAIGKGATDDELEALLDTDNADSGTLDEATPTNTSGGGMAKTGELDLSKLDPEVAGVLSKMQEQFDELRKDNEDLAAALAEALAGDEDDDPDTDDTPNTNGANANGTEVGKVDLSKLDPAVRAMVEGIQKSANDAVAEAKANGEIAKAERDQRLDREYIAKAATIGSHLPGVKLEKSDDPKDTNPVFGVVLRKVAELAPSEYAEIERVLSAANEAIKQGDLMKSIGSDLTNGVTGTNAVSVVNAKAGELRKSDTSITFEQAVAEVLRTNPGLYEQYQTEKRQGVTQ